MIPVRRLGPATYVTSDVAGQVEYYKEVIGLFTVEQTPQRAVMASRMGHEAVIFEHGDHPGCRKLSFQVAPDVDFNDVGRQLDIAGEYRSDVTPGIARSFLLTDPCGIEIELFQSPAFGPPQPVTGVGVMKAGHISFAVPDCKRLSDFYIEKFGFRVSDWMGDFFVFLRCNADHHTVNFSTHQKTPRAHVHHFAFELRDWAQVQTACEVLSQHKRPIIWGPGRHGIGHGIFVYHRDPDDHIIEFYAEIDQMKEESLGYFDPRPWHEDQPQRPKAWEPDKAALTWGMPPTPDFVRGTNREMQGAPAASGRGRYMPT